MTFEKLLSDRRLPQFTRNLINLKEAVSSGKVPNVLFKDSKDVINRAVEEALKSYDDKAKTPYEQRCTLVMGAYNLNSALKEAMKFKDSKRADFIRSMLPLNDLIQSAKPLIVKRGQGPKVPTAKQVAKLAKAMTCQCCQRQIFAETGKIAHHGYERHGSGWQTASCMGALYLPFEVDRSRLAAIISAMRSRLKSLRQYLAKVETEAVGVPFTVFIGYDHHHRGIYKTFTTSREGWKKASAIYSEVMTNRFDKLVSFEDLKAREVSLTERSIKNLSGTIKREQARYDAWKQTHELKNKAWVKIGGGK